MGGKRAFLRARPADYSKAEDPAARLREQRSELLMAHKPAGFDA